VFFCFSSSFFSFYRKYAVLSTTLCFLPNENSPLCAVGCPWLVFIVGLADLPQPPYICSVKGCVYFDRPPFANFAAYLTIVNRGGSITFCK
jgi:hypothetical protein